MGGSLVLPGLARLSRALPTPVYPFEEIPAAVSGITFTHTNGKSAEKYLPETIKGWPNHNIIIGSDFDHGDAVATWPRTVEVIKTMPGLSEQDKEKVLGGNAMRLFGMNGNGAAKP